MPRAAEVALARSAAPLHISERATIKVLTASGYEVVREGDNGFVCMVMRGGPRRPTHRYRCASSSTTPRSVHRSASTPLASRTVMRIRAAKPARNRRQGA